MKLAGQRIAVYARYSTDKQSAASLDDQLRVCREYAERAGGTIGDDLVFVDAGISGASTARRGLQDLLTAVREKLVDVVITEDLARLGRSVGNNDRVLKDFQSAGARLIALNDGFDTAGGKSRLLGAIKSAMAEDYLDELKLRTKRGLDGLHDAGMHTGGSVYGYRSEAVDDGTRRRLVIDESTAPTVRRIFAEWTAGNGLRVIAERLNRDGIPAPRGPRWQTITIRALLANDIYSGTVIFNKRAWSRDDKTGKRRNVIRPPSEWRRTARPELQIVDGPTWHAARDRAAVTARRYERRTRERRDYPLSGLLHCGECGSLLTILGAGYYACSGRKRGLECSNRSSLRESAVRSVVLETLRNTMGAPDLIQRVRAGWASGVGDADRELREELRQRRVSLSQIESRLLKLMDLILDEGRTETTTAKRGELEDHADLQRAAISRIESALTAVPELPSPDRILTFLIGLPAMAASDPEIARQFVGAATGGRIDCRPPTAPRGPFTLAFTIHPGALIEKTEKTQGRVFSVLGSCGGAIVPKSENVEILALCPNSAGK